MFFVYYIFHLHLKKAAQECFTMRRKSIICRLYQKGKMKRMKTVIMAGGRGTRIASINAEVPKPMIEICGKPILEYQIECLQRQNMTEIILVIGYLGDVIEQHFGTGEAYGVQIKYIREKEPLGTAGALYYLKSMIKEDFLLINGDIIFDVDIDRFLNVHRKNHALAGERG